MTRGISGYVCVRNAIQLDYCVVESVRSLLPVCDEVVVCDGESTDGTRKMIEGMGEPKIRILDYPWANPDGDSSFWVEWLNWARVRLNYDFQLTLDADEVLDPAGYDAIRLMAKLGECGIFSRLNFWRDAQHLAPSNRVCGDTVARCGPTYLYCPSDEPNPAMTPNIRTHASLHPDLRIFHYGFLRDKNAFVRKSKAVQQMFMGSCDSRIIEQETLGKDWDERDYFDGEPLLEYNGLHPEVALYWLAARGHNLK